MRKNQLLTIFFIFILLFMPFSSVVIASEAENIDSFDVHPANRWIETDTGVIVTVEDGLLNMTDVGDGTDDSYIISRDLRDLDGSVEIKFKVDSNSSSTVFRDSFRMSIIGATTNEYVRLWLINAKDTSLYSASELRFSTTDGDSDSIDVGSYIFDDLWYKCRFDYDMLKSELRIRLFFENNTKLFDFDYFDVIESGNFADLFGETTLSVRLQTRSFTIGNRIEVLVDYVRAPFKEREWSQFDTPVDSDYLTDQWNVAWAQDDIDETSAWSLTVPFFDSVSGVLRVELPNRDHATFTTGGDTIAVTLKVFTVDNDDGDLTEAIALSLATYEEGGGDLSDLQIILDGGIPDKTLGAITDTSADISQCTFSIASMEDRSSLSLQLEVEFDETDIQRFYGEVALSDVSASASQEFVLRVFYICDLDKNTEIMAAVTGFSLLSRDIWSDVGNFIDDVIGTGQEAFDAGAGLFAIVFTWLANALLFGFQVIIDGLQLAFETALTGLELALETALGLVETAIGAVQTAVEAVTTAIGLLAAQIISALVDAVDELITAILLVAEELADLLFAVIDFLLDLILDVLDELWAIFVGIVFFAWDALSLPDVLGAFDLLLVGFGQAIAGFGQFVTDINAIIGHIFTLSVAGGLFIFFFLPITIAPTIGGWIEKVLQFLAFDITFGFSPMGVVPRVPAGAVWIAIVIGSGVLSGSILGGFF